MSKAFEKNCSLNRLLNRDSLSKYKTADAKENKGRRSESVTIYYQRPQVIYYEVDGLYFRRNEPVGERRVLRVGAMCTLSDAELASIYGGFTISTNPVKISVEEYDAGIEHNRLQQQNQY